MKLPRISIGARIVILALVTVLPLLLLVLYEAEQDRREFVKVARQEALYLARAQAAIHGSALNRTRDLLHGVALTAGLDARIRDGDCGQTLAAVVEGSRLHTNAVLADSEGRVRCSLRPLTGSVSLADREYFRSALAQKGFAASGLLTGRVTQSQVLVGAQAVLDAERQARGVLSAVIDTGRLASLFKVNSLPPGAVLILADVDGRVVARHPHVAGLEGEIIPDLAAQKARAGSGDEGFFDFVGLGGVDRVAAFARLADAPEWPLYVVAGIPRAEVERHPRNEVMRDLGVIAFVLALALTLSLVGAQRLLVAPLRQLGRFAERYEKGELSARSGIGHDSGEIGELARRFDQLAAHNQRVTRALKALSAGNRTVLREKTETALLPAMCRVAVEHAGYRVAFVNYLQHDERKSVRTVARAGDDGGFVDALDLTWADTERGRGSVGMAIRTGKTNVVRSMAADARFAPWREAAVAQGFGSVASFPLHIDGEVIGTFTLIAAEEDAFDNAELELLDEMAADLAFGIGVLRSEARRVAAEQEARRAATHDAATGLPNRSLFLNTVAQATQEAVRKGQEVAVLVALLPDVQALQESLGYQPADAAVVEAAARLRFAMAPASVLARLGAEEFALLLPGGGADAAEELARRLNGLLQAPVAVAGIPIDVRVRFGVALFPMHGEDADVLVRRAGIAAREAARWDAVLRVYGGASDRENPARLALAAELRRAIQQRELLLHLQAKVELASGAVCGAEALVRWPHPDKGMIPPAQFVPVAEQTGLIRPLTALVIELAIRQLAAWRDRHPPVPIAINLSQRNLHEPRLVEQIEKLLADAGVPAQLLQFELTESVVAEDPEAVRAVLNRLRALGCKLYIDDFGTGYSSLSYLVSLPVHALKIDRSFVSQMARSREALGVVKSIISMAKELSLRTVAEGVETQEDADLLRRLGCDEAQGYFFARPVPADEFV